MRQVVVSVLIQARDDGNVYVKAGRADKLGQPPVLERDSRGVVSELEDVVVAAIGLYFYEIIAELRGEPLSPSVLPQPARFSQPT
jgi:hypothetical protein